MADADMASTSTGEGTSLLPPEEPTGQHGDYGKNIGQKLFLFIN